MFSAQVAKWIQNRPKPQPGIDLTRGLRDGMTLLPHQPPLIQRIIDINGRVILSAPPGTGKTVMMVTTASIYGGHCICLVPSPKREDFHRHFTQWVRPEIYPGGIHLLESLAEIQKQPTPTLPTVWIMTHEITHRALKVLLRTKWNVVMVDEAHKMKSPESKCSHALYALAAEARSVVLATGTPMPNRIGEYYSLVHALYPQTFTDFELFSERYGGGHRDPYTGWWKEQGKTNETEFEMIRSLVEVTCDPLPLIPMVHKTVECEITFPTLDEMRAEETDLLAHMKQVKDRVVELSKEIKDVKDDTKKLLEKERKTLVREGKALEQKHYRLQQYMKYPTYESMVFEEKQYRKRIREVEGEDEAADKERAHLETERMTLVGIMRAKTGLAKVPFVIEYVKSLPKDTNTIVFMYHLECAQRVHAGLPGSIYIADLPAKKREPLVADLRTGSGKIGILTLKASCAGIEVQPATTEVVIGEKDYTPEMEHQASKRAHRIGTTRTVTTHTIIAKNSYDTSMVSMHKGKLRTIQCGKNLSLT